MSRACYDPGMRPRLPRSLVPWLLAGGVAAGLTLSCTGVRRGGDENQDLVRTLVPEVAVSSQGMVAASAEEATAAGAAVLARGGNAMDAAVAVAFALGVADPGDSGLGGATYILVRMADGRSAAVDGSTPIPLAVDREKLTALLDKGAQAGPELCAVPASLAALDVGLHGFGTMKLAEVMQPAIDIAEQGYVVTPFQRAAAEKYITDILATDVLRWIILRDGKEIPPVGERIVRPDLARTLRRIAAGGPAEFYRGGIAAEIEADMVRRGGFVRRRDLARLRVPVLRPLEGTYRGYDVVSFPSPGGGGAVIEELNILERFPEELLRGNSVDRLQLLVEAAHVALDDDRAAKRTLNLPQELQDRHHLEKSFAAARAATIALGRQAAGGPSAPTRGTPEMGDQTVQISVVDRWGNAVSLTQTLYRFYGNKVVPKDLGFVYNSGLEFFDPHDPNLLRPHAVFPTDMAPTILVKDGKPLLVLGSAASGRIPGVVTGVISEVVDRGLDGAGAVAAPRVLWSWAANAKGVIIETVPPLTGAMADELAARGMTVARRLVLPAPALKFVGDGAVNAVYRDPATGVLTGLGDARRGYTARGVEASESGQQHAAGDGWAKAP